LSPVFEVLPEAIFFQQTNLICEITLNSFSYIFENDAEKNFSGLYVFNFRKDEDVSTQLKNIFQHQPLLTKNYKKVFICFSGEESALLPVELYKPGANELLLNTLYGDLNDEIILTDLVPDKKIYNVYRMPAAIHKVIAEQFPLAAFTHQYSLLLKQDFNKSDLLHVTFYNDSFVATVVKAGDLQLMHTYLYRSITDIIYHLKNICDQFKMENVSLHIGGMIEKDSALDKELRHYFTNITFDELPAGYEFSAGLKELPAHYFSHLFSLALCV
jgi:hypothetical protein